jgi:hypothetical protein
MKSAFDVIELREHPDGSLCMFPPNWSCAFKIHVMGENLFEKHASTFALWGVSPANEKIGIFDYKLIARWSKENGILVFGQPSDWALCYIGPNYARVVDFTVSEEEK